MSDVVRLRHQAEQIRRYGHSALGAPSALDLDEYAEEITRLRAENERLRGLRCASCNRGPASAQMLEAEAKWSIRYADAIMKDSDND